jgi:hypothetical protein
LVIASVALGAFASCAPGNQAPFKAPVYVTSGQFTTAHPSVLGAVEDYFNTYRTHVPQPVAFTHKAHLGIGMRCADCHQGVTHGPNATIPNVQFCMTCHQVIAVDKPEIKKVAAYQERGEEIPWQRVYWYYPAADVKFAHAPHVRAGINCATCHGDMKEQSTAVRKAGLDMGFCLGCHRMKKASTDCAACHF